MDNTSTLFRTTTYVGLIITLLLTTIFWYPSVYQSILPTDFELRNYLMQGIDWLVVLIICGLILFGERDKLSTLQFKPITFEAFSLGMALGGFSMLYLVAHRFLVNFSGPNANFGPDLSNPGLDTVGPAFIYVYGLFSLLTAGIAEEIIYRGYATERLLRLQENKWVAFLLPWAAFTLMHYRKGLDHMLGVAAVAALMQWYYMKYRNLTITVIGHLFIDLMALVGIFYEHYTRG
ncbi:MAG: CPBP family intramembrane metalloprotease [Saprospiraceae bacterium]|nr:CPBP family intramembrane metalloprotease [Saprospiraceae bacterium]